MEWILSAFPLSDSFPGSYILMLRGSWATTTASRQRIGAEWWWWAGFLIAGRCSATFQRQIFTQRPTSCSVFVCGWCFIIIVGDEARCDHVNQPTWWCGMDPDSLKQGQGKQQTLAQDGLRWCPRCLSLACHLSFRDDTSAWTQCSFFVVVVVLFVWQPLKSLNSIYLCMHSFQCNQPSL